MKCVGRSFRFGLPNWKVRPTIDACLFMGAEILVHGVLLGAVKG